MQYIGAKFYPNLASNQHSNHVYTGGLDNEPSRVVLQCLSLLYIRPRIQLILVRRVQ